MSIDSLATNSSLATYIADQEYSKYGIPTGWPSIVWVTDDMNDSAAEYSEAEDLIETHVTQAYTNFIIGTQDINDYTQWQNYVDEFEKLGLN